MQERVIRIREDQASMYYRNLVIVRLATLNTTYLKVLLGILAILLINVLFTHTTWASMATNSRLNNGNAWNYCHDNNGPGYFAKGMVWLSNNNSDYYSEDVTVGSGATSVYVSIRGAVNTCNTVFGGATNMYAINVSTSWLSGMSGDSFYRGQVPGGSTYAWSSAGDKLYGYLDVRNVALCTAASLATGSARQTVIVSITRQQRQIRPGYDWTSPIVGTEDVPVTVTRTCPTYNYNLTPTMSVTPRTASPGSSVQPLPAVNNTGTTTSASVNWAVTQFTLAPGASVPTGLASGGPSAQTPAAYFSSVTPQPVTNGTSTFPTSVTPITVPLQTLSATLSVGSQVCFVLSLQPYTQSSSNYNYSRPDCVLISKAPLVTISGGDLMVGRSLPAPSPSAAITVGRSVIGSRTYGSWAEYAAFSPGASIIATGGNLASTTTQTTPAPSGNSSQPLTFANNNTLGGDGLFGGMGTQTNLTTHYATTPAGYLTPPLPLNLSSLTAGRNYYYNFGATPLTISGSLPKGVTLILVGTALITVNGNITYPSGTYTDISDISQLLLLTTGNIRINNNVTHIDAWLYAGGTISTCDAIQPQVPAGSYVNGLGAGASYPCDANPLVINGPVVATHLQLRRTYGASVDQGLSKAAESFNLRADTSLWAKSQAIQTGTVKAVSTQELPPRY